MVAVALAEAKRAVGDVSALANALGFASGLASGLIVSGLSGILTDSGFSAGFASSGFASAGLGLSAEMDKVRLFWRLPTNVYEFEFLSVCLNFVNTYLPVSPVRH